MSHFDDDDDIFSDEYDYEEEEEEYDVHANSDDEELFGPEHMKRYQELLEIVGRSNDESNNEDDAEPENYDPVKAAEPPAAGTATSNLSRLCLWNAPWESLGVVFNMWHATEGPWDQCEKWSAEKHLEVARDFVNILPLSVWDDEVHIELYDSSPRRRGHRLAPDCVVIRASPRYVMRKHGSHHRLVRDSQHFQSRWRLEHNLYDSELECKFSGYVVSIDDLLSGSFSEDIAYIVQSSCCRLYWMDDYEYAIHQGNGKFVIFDRSPDTQDHNDRYECEYPWPPTSEYPPYYFGEREKNRRYSSFEAENVRRLDLLLSCREEKKKKKKKKVNLHKRKTAARKKKSKKENLADVINLSAIQVKKEEDC